MYGKFFSSTYTGSMFGAGSDVFAVWGYVIAHTQKGQVELNPKLLAAIIGTPENRIAAAIETLCSADPKSRSKIEDGKRLIREGEYAYRVPTYYNYRRIRDEDDRREYNRRKKAEQRKRQKVKPSQYVSIRESNMSAQAEAEAEAEVKSSGTSISSSSQKTDDDDVEKVVSIFQSLPVTSGKVSQKDRVTAQTLLRSYSIEQIEGGLLLASARRNGNGSKIQSLAYFVDAIKEAAVDSNMSASYVDYLRSKVRKR